MEAAMGRTDELTRRELQEAVRALTARMQELEQSLDELCARPHCWHGLNGKPKRCCECNKTQEVGESGADT